nr:MAG TPA: hypothetical protein [Caudoviricetes sp.]
MPFIISFRVGIVLVAAPHRQHSRPFAPKQNLK